MVLRLLAVLLFAGASVAQAQESGLAFLRIGPNAEALAMGDAMTAHGVGAYATYWNPAGLAVDQGNEVGLGHHFWVADTRTYALAARFQAGAAGGLGLFVTATGNTDLEARQRPGEAEGLFGVQFVSTGVAYGRTLGPIRAGVTAKFISERIYTNTANGYAFDAGVQADLLNESLRLGASVQNVGEMNELNAEATPLPRTLRVGAALYPFRIRAATDDAPLLSTLITAEVVHLFPDERTQVHTGIAAEVLETVFVRVGVITNDTLRDVTLGAGLHAAGLLFDYALVPFESGFGGPGHVLTLTYGW